MAKLISIYWRDIPAQVVGRAGRTNVKKELAPRFANAIDRAAMRAGRGSSDAYLADWRRAEPAPCGDDLAAEADRAAAEIERAYDSGRLKALIANGGRTP